jgi:hypothetical protein
VREGTFGQLLRGKDVSEKATNQSTDQLNENCRNLDPLFIALRSSIALFEDIYELISTDWCSSRG